MLLSRRHERVSGSMASGMEYTAKHSSQNNSSSLSISSAIQGQKPTFAKDVQKQGMSLRPGVVKDTLTKSWLFFF